MDSAICGSIDYTADRKTVVAWSVYFEQPDLMDYKYKFINH